MNERKREAGSGQVKESYPKMSEFDKGYILGKTESMAEEAGHKETVKKE